MQLALSHGEEERCRLEHARFLLGVPCEQRRSHLLRDRLARRDDQLDERPRLDPCGVVAAALEGAHKVDVVDLTEPGWQRVERGNVDRAAHGHLALEVLPEEVCVEEEAVRLGGKRRDRAVESRIV